MRTILFHVCKRVYKPGAVKPAGTYWKGLVAAGQSATMDPLGEFLREAVRAASYSHKPSRVHSSFAFDSLCDATVFRNSFRQGATIYRVRFLNSLAICHRVTWSAFQPGSPIPLHLQANEFWNGAMLYSSNVEVFAESDLEFV